MEYKEFWIAQGSLADIVCYNEKQAIDLQWTKNPIHVIEYAAFEKLKKQNEIMREALSFYANEMNYSIDDYRGISGEMIKRCILYTDCEERNDVYSYAGKRARQALKDVEGVG